MVFQKQIQLLKFYIIDNQIFIFKKIEYNLNFCEKMIFAAENTHRTFVP